MDGIHFLFTGGTIDSKWDGTKDTAVPLAHSAIPEYIASLQLHPPHSCTEICMKDSRDITDEDRVRLADEITKSPYEKILVTHGTYTMPMTAEYLRQHLVDNQKVIILTGSMTPLAGMSPSDGGFNIGFAIGSMDLLKPGVYLGMNGKIFKAGDVHKNTSIGRFEGNQE